MRKTSKILFNDKTDNGFHANYASVRIYDSSHCILWNWKVAAVIITMIFGGTPVVRLTVLGLRGVPETIREAAIAYGASKWYLLRKVDLPLATPSILAGVNQTVMLSLAMVVVASLIGAKGLGQDVLEALQYANVGQGILAGVAILFVALILDRVVQRKKRV